MPPKTYTFEQVAEQIEKHLGQRPALSTLRAAAATQRRTVTDRLSTRLCAGMPPAVAKRGKESLFRATDIDAWLAAHPVRLARSHQDKVRQAAAAKSPQELERAVHAARSAGLSWTLVAQAISQGRGTSYSKQRAQAKFG